MFAYSVQTALFEVYWLGVAGSGVAKLHRGPDQGIGGHVQTQVLPGGIMAKLNPVIGALPVDSGYYVGG